MLKGLNIGCGPLVFRSDSFVEWENSDFADTESAASWPIDKKRDFTKPFEDLGDNSVDIILGWHIVEHIELGQNAAVIREWNRVLKPGGSLLLACPDVGKIAKHIVDRDGPWADWFTCMVNIFGPYNGFVGDFHKWGYDVENLGKLLRENGFSNTTELTPGRLVSLIGAENANKVGFAEYNIQMEGTK